MVQRRQPDRRRAPVSRDHAVVRDLSDDLAAVGRGSSLLRCAGASGAARGRDGRFLRCHRHRPVRGDPREHPLRSGAVRARRGEPPHPGRLRGARVREHRAGDRDRGREASAPLCRRAELLRGGEPDPRPDPDSALRAAGRERRPRRERLGRGRGGGDGRRRLDSPSGRGRRPDPRVDAGPVAGRGAGDGRRRIRPVAAYACILRALGGLDAETLELLGDVFRRKRRTPPAAPQAGAAG